MPASIPATAASKTDASIDWITSVELFDECDTPARIYRLSDIAIR